MERRSAFNNTGLIFNNFFEDVPNHRLLLFYHFLGLLDVEH